MAGIGTGFAALSIGRKLAAAGIGVLVFVGIALLIWWRVSAYGAERYRQGVTDTDTKWEAAKAKLEAQARASATRADDNAVKRLDEYKAQEDADRKAIDDANSNGTSPLDAIFG